MLDLHTSLPGRQLNEVSSASSISQPSMVGWQPSGTIGGDWEVTRRVFNRMLDERVLVVTSLFLPCRW